MLFSHSVPLPTSPVAFLAALLANPDFKLGVAEAQEVFLEWHEPEALTEGEMISEIEVELGRRVVELERNGCRAAGLQPTPYLYSIGFVIGTIAQGLSYANPSKPEQEGESC